MIQNSKKGVDEVDNVVLAFSFKTFFFPLLYFIWNWEKGLSELSSVAFFHLRKFPCLSTESSGLKSFNEVSDK